MAALLKLVDEHFGADARSRTLALELRLASERVTLREIIRRRVEAEVKIANERGSTYAESHGRTRSHVIEVEAASPEAVLNPMISRRKRRPPVVTQEVVRALAAFHKRRFIMLLDDRQIDELDAEVTLMPESELVFLYLSPLKGG